MLNVTFGNFKSYEDFGLILKRRVINAPAIRTAYVPIAGSSTTLDYTDYFGEPMFDNRTIELEFLAFVPYENQGTVASQIRNAIHGRQMQIGFDDDINTGGTYGFPDWYFFGRVSVGAGVYDRGAMTIPVTCICEPYKYAAAETEVTATAAAGATATVTLSGGRMTVIPKITVTGAPVTLAFEIDDISYTAALSASEEPQTVEGLVLRNDSVDVSVTNTGNAAATVVFSWRDGAL